MVARERRALVPVPAGGLAVDARSLDRPWPRWHVSPGVDDGVVGQGNWHRAFEGSDRMVPPAVPAGDGGQAGRTELLGAGDLLRRGSGALPDLLVHDDGADARHGASHLLRRDERLPDLFAGEDSVRRRVQRHRRVHREVGARALHHDFEGRDRAAVAEEEPPYRRGDARGRTLHPGVGAVFGRLGRGAFSAEARRPLDSARGGPLDRLLRRVHAAEGRGAAIRGSEEMGSRRRPLVSARRAARHRLRGAPFDRRPGGRAFHRSHRAALAVGRGRDRMAGCKSDVVAEAPQ